MATQFPDPLDVAGDDLYRIYRRGIITRHIASNGRFLESIALESLDDASNFASGDTSYVEIRSRIGVERSSPQAVLRIPKSACRYSIEVDLLQPTQAGMFAVRPMVWAPLLAPIKYPGIPLFDRYLTRPPASPWLPQSGGFRRFSIKRHYWALCSSRADNPAYYGGMALAAFSQEHILGVSPCSLTYARKLVEGLLAMEMSDHNGYLIRYDRWHSKAGEVKKIRGASAEELLGLMVGLMYYLRAEDAIHPLREKAEALRERVLSRLAGGGPNSKYDHPFMSQAYTAKLFEWPMAMSAGRDGGYEALYRNLVTQRAGLSASIWDALENIDFSDDRLNFFDYPMFLTSMVLLLDSPASDSTKEYYAEIFLRDFIKAAYQNGPDKNALKGNAYMGVVALMCNKYLNSERKSDLLGPKLLAVFGGDLTLWYELVAMVDRLILNASSIGNSNVSPPPVDQWQHNLPLFTWINTDGVPSGESEVWAQHNPHRRLGAHFEWHHMYPQWFRNPQDKSGRYGEYVVGWGGEQNVDGATYLAGNGRRYDSLGYVYRELARSRGHHDTQIEGSGVGLMFLRMLAANTDSQRYPPPQLSDAAVQWPVLPFPGVEALDPKFLHCVAQCNTRDDGLPIGGDRDEALRLLALPSVKLFVSATSTTEEILKLETWRVAGSTIDRLSILEVCRADLWLLRKTSLPLRPQRKNILLLLVRAEEERPLQSDQHWVDLHALRIAEDGSMSPLARVQVSAIHPSAGAELAMCVLDYRVVCVLFKNRHGTATMKLMHLDAVAGTLTEKVSQAAEAGSGISVTQVAGKLFACSAYDKVIIVGYVYASSPYHHLRILSRVWDGSSLKHRGEWTGVATKGRPATAVTLTSGSNYFLLVASFYPNRHSGIDYPMLMLQSWRISRDGDLTFVGSFDTREHIDDLLLRPGAYDFERLSIARGELQYEGEFILSAKGKVGSGNGMVLLYGRLTEEGLPTLLDWNCAGGGADDSVSMTDLCSGLSIDGIPGVIAGYKSAEGGMCLTAWQFREAFSSAEQLLSMPARRVVGRDPKRGWNADGCD